MKEKQGARLPRSKLPMLLNELLIAVHELRRRNLAKGARRNIKISNPRRGWSAFDGAGALIFLRINADKQSGIKGKWILVGKEHARVLHLFRVATQSAATEL
jgi:hypothetical protein